MKIFVFALISLFLFSGCIQEQPTPSETTSEKIIILSFSERFCIWTETSQPFAFEQFAYQENGEIKYIKTKTNCGDFDSQVRGEPFFGEKVTLHGNISNPTAITREDGTYYEVEPSAPTRSFFTVEMKYPNSLADLKERSTFLRRDQVISECKLLNNSREHDNCLSYMSALEE